MRKHIEKAYGTALYSTLKTVNPVKKKIINTHCLVHKFIQQHSLNILKNEGHMKEYILFMSYIEDINKGLVWADQDFKSYSHFYNPLTKKGKYGYEDNAMILARRYYNKAVKFYAMKRYKKSMFFFGAACHIIQDLTIPQHAKGKLLDKHRQFETFVKKHYNMTANFRVERGSIKLNSISEYVDFNAKMALKIDERYEDIEQERLRFYKIAMKSLALSQKSTAGCMLMFYNDLFIRNM